MSCTLHEPLLAKLKQGPHYGSLAHINDATPINKIPDDLLAKVLGFSDNLDFASFYGPLSQIEPP